ncbi:hypothetical protein [Weeksella virosa]|uniref:Uncharacterized protein n=1 Tax=Weeksella virosa (strain ATCC 43766 / DSM 16922 / JCM 21250 / CCUG 30538 / CDC 9751 / IAM 14551 / NBRC 16016 / NCTC 11634 / CL345/78) TaxID=865938 RepID=F0P2T5_WEEVC|nr:hypothetical protein [Weeksella virosa]ADX66825.1 hypothetical protein Weevi_0099 [Weeksella virosa DSM 16922]VEH63451.1 Uncharacterised protein [Weeksella virosa]
MENTPTESTSIADKSTLKNWFKTGLKPLQNHFWMWLDSYWHKSESIPISSIQGLANAIDGKASVNHTHSEYATNDASSLTEADVLSWKEALDVANLQFDDEAISITQPYPAYGLNGDEKQADYNIANYDAVQKRLEKPIVESDTTDHPFVVAVDEDGESAMIPAADFGKVDTVMGVSADENKNVDISGVAMNWTNPSHRFSAIPDKSADATFTEVVGMDESGNIGKIGGVALINKVLELQNDDPALISLFYKLNGNFASSSRINVVDIFPPILEETTGLKTLTVLGSGLVLPEDERISYVEAIHLETNNNYRLGYQNDTVNVMKVFFDTNIYPIGTYKLRIVSGVQANISVNTFEVKEQGSITEIDVNTLTWNNVKREGSTQSENSIKVLAPNDIKISREYGQDIGLENYTVTKEILFSDLVFTSSENFSIEMDVVYKGQVYSNLGAGSINEFNVPDSIGLINNEIIDGNELKGTFSELFGREIKPNATNTKTITNFWWGTNLRLKLLNDTERIVPSSEWHDAHIWRTSIVITKRNGILYYSINGFNQTNTIGNAFDFRLLFGVANSKGTQTYESIQIKRIIKWQ